MGYVQSAVFVNKVLPGHSQTHSLTHCLWWCLYEKVEFSSYNRDPEASHTYYLASHREVQGPPCFKPLCNTYALLFSCYRWIYWNSERLGNLPTQLLKSKNLVKTWGLGDSRICSLSSLQLTKATSVITSWRKDFSNMWLTIGLLMSDTGFRVVHFLLPEGYSITLTFWEFTVFNSLRVDAYGLVCLILEVNFHNVSNFSI